MFFGLKKGPRSEIDDFKEVSFSELIGELLSYW